MYSIIKGVVLFMALLIVLPIVFFLILRLFGVYFSISVNHNSWFYRTGIKWIKGMFKQ